MRSIEMKDWMQNIAFLYYLKGVKIAKYFRGDKNIF